MPSNWLRFRTYQPILIVCVAACFYLYEFFLRVSPSVLTHELMHFYHTGADVLGSIMGSFFLAYTLMQIPSGLLGDHFGPRKVLTCAAIICAIATALFTLSNAISIGILTRFLLGFSASFAYIAPLMLASRWFPTRYFALMTGLIQMMGCIGAMVGGTPVVTLTAHYGWQTTLIWAAWIGLFLSLCFWIIIRDAPSKTRCPEITALSRETTLNILSRLKKVCHHRQTWAIALIGFACWAPVSIFAELWGIPFLERAYHLSTYDAAQLMRYVWWGIAFGGPTMGYLSDHINSRKAPIIIALCLALLSSYLVIYHHPNTTWLPFILLAFGAAASAQCVTFGCVRDVHPLTVAGTAVGFNNMAVIMGGVFCQPLVGVFLEQQWTGQWIDHAHAFSPHAYQMAFLLIPCCTLLGVISTCFFLKETHCQKQY